MWMNNGVGNNEGFQNNFNNQDDYPHSPFEGSQGQRQYLPQLPFSQNMMQFEGGNGEGLMNNEFQPEIGLFNEGAYAQNQLVNRAHAQFSPSPRLNSNNMLTANANTPTPLRPITSISSRAAELKAQLLRGRERASSATPPSGMMGQDTKPAGAPDGSSSLRGSPTTPAVATEASEQELNIKELISQYAGPKPSEDIEMKDDRLGILNHPKRPSSFPEPSAKSQVSSLGSPTKVSKPNNSKMIHNGIDTKNHGNRTSSRGSRPEGEVFEDTPVKKALPAKEPQETKVVAKTVVNEEGSGPRRTRDEQPLRSSRGRETSPRRSLPSNSKSQAPRYPEDRGNETDPRQDRRPYTSKNTIERKPNPPDAERSPLLRRDSREQNEDHRTSETKSEKRDDTNRTNREARLPTLAKLLPHDEDLKEWLEITGYHNEDYRNKILNRRRAIAALDAQRNALLAEMAAEERGGIPAIGGVPTPAVPIFPPPTSNKVGDRTEPSATPTTNTAPETQRDRVVSKKRPQSDALDGREESSSKIARTTDRGSRIKQEDEADYGRPRSSGYDASRRRTYDDRPHDRDSSRPRYDEDHGRSRGSSRERDVSPGRKAYDSRPIPQTRAYKAGSDSWVRDEDVWEDRERERERPSRGDSRPFVIRGGYRGRAFDPNYRGRGRGGGRGRGDLPSHTEPKGEPGAFGGRSATGKRFKDSGGYDRGGKGGQ